MTSFLKKIPYLSLIPLPILKPICHIFENKKIWEEIKEISSSRMTINRLNLIIKQVGLKIFDEEFFFIRPSHEIRYGWKTKKSNLGKIPFLKENQ